MMKIYTKVKSFLARKEEGASMAEYGLLLALIAVVCIAAITTLGTELKQMFTEVGTTIGAVDGTGS